MSRHPATCEHDWARPRCHGKDACRRCPATCERDERGKVIVFDADPGATAGAEAKSAERRRSEREAVKVPA